MVNFLQARGRLLLSEIRGAILGFFCSFLIVYKIGKNFHDKHDNYL